MAFNRFYAPGATGATGGLVRGTRYTSVLDLDALNVKVTGDTYFDNTGAATGDKISRVDVIYEEQSEERQQVRVQHYGGQGTLQLTTAAKVGTWQQKLIKMYDHDGAIKSITRAGGATFDVTVI